MSSIKIIPLFSGSSGNCTYVCADGINLLIDIGFNCKQTLIAMDKAGIDPSIIDAVLITHSHSDHIAGVDVFIRKYPSKLIATTQTHHVLARRASKPHPETEDIVIRSGEELILSDTVRIIPFATTHDAVGSVCYKIIAGDKSAMVMTDLGYVSGEMIDFVCGVDGALVEANYDEQMLVYGPYDEYLKARIAGEGGHISNDECGILVDQMIKHGANKFILGHLSDNNNTPDRAFGTVTEFLAKNNHKLGVDYFLSVAKRYEPTEAIII